MLAFAACEDALAVLLSGPGLPPVGGVDNAAYGVASFVGGGVQNTASGPGATVAGGGTDSDPPSFGGGNTAIKLGFTLSSPIQNINIRFGCRILLAGKFKGRRALTEHG